MLNYFLIVFLLFSSAFGEVQKINSLEEIQTETITDKDLVIFDVDETLLMSSDILLRPCGKRCLTGLMVTYNQKLHPIKRDYLASQVLLQREARTVEPLAPSFIQKLQSQNIKVMALTAMPTKSFGAIPCMVQWRVEELQKLGYDFSTTFPEHPNLTFAGNAFPVVFKHGILCSADTPKGEALVTFLHKIEWFPERVIFIDNRHSHLESVDNSLQELEIPHTGYHYLAAYDVPGELDEKVIDLQINTLIEKEVWLSDEEARELLN